MDDAQRNEEPRDHLDQLASRDALRFDDDGALIVTCGLYRAARLDEAIAASPTNGAALGYPCGDVIGRDNLSLMSCRDTASVLSTPSTARVRVVGGKGDPRAWLSDGPT